MSEGHKIRYGSMTRIEQGEIKHRSVKSIVALLNRYRGIGIGIGIDIGIVGIGIAVAVAIARANCLHLFAVSHWMALVCKMVVFRVG